MVVWTALFKAVARDVLTSDMVVRAKSSSEAWTVLNSIIEDKDRDLAEGNAEKCFGSLGMMVGEPVREHLVSYTRRRVTL